jgi:SAM-dependent methyltransferase
MARVDYDRMAPAYVTGRALPPEGMAPWRDAIRPWLPRDLGDRSPVLDLGAGTGQFAAVIAGWFGVEVVAVEPSGGMRAQAARAFPHGGVRWVAGLAERLPLGDRTCAWAWVSTVVHHLDDLEAAAAELRRVLRPAAPVLVRQAFPGRMDEISLYRRFFPAAGASLVEGGGLPSVERLSASSPGPGSGPRPSRRSTRSARPAWPPTGTRSASGPTPACACCPTTSSPPGWPPSTGPWRRRRPRPRSSTGSTCWCCAADPPGGQACAPPDPG